MDKGQRLSPSPDGQMPPASMGTLMFMSDQEQPEKSRKLASSWITNHTNLPSVRAQRYLLFKCVLMEINPRLTPPGMVNIISEEWGEARRAELREQSCLGLPAVTDMWWNRPKQDTAGLYGLSSSSAGPL